MRRTKELERAALGRLKERLEKKDAFRAQFRKKPLAMLARFGYRFMGPMKELFEDIFEDRVDSAVAVACRGGGKTHGAAGLGTSEFLLDDWNVFVVSGSLDQATNLLGDVQEITGDEEVQELIEGETKTLVKGKDGNWIKAVAASTKATRGPHAKGRKLLLILDEEAEMNPDVVYAALNIGNDAKRFVVLRISTMHKLTGTFRELVDRHKQMGYKLYKWDSFDVATNCTTKNCRDCLAAHREGNEDQIEQLTQDFHDKYCHERVKAKGREAGWIKVETIRRKFFELPISKFQSEVMAMEPSGEGLVLPYGKTKAALAAPLVEYVKGSPIWASVDWGFVDQMVVFVLQQIGNNLVLLDAHHWTGTDVEMLEMWLRGAEETYEQPISWINPDSSHPFNNNLLREAGWEVEEIVFGAYKETGAGKLNMLFERERIKLAAKLSEDVVSQFLGWSRGADGKIKKGHDHYPDALLCGTKRVMANIGEGTARARKWNPRAGRRFFDLARGRRGEAADVR